MMIDQVRVVRRLGAYLPAWLLMACVGTSSAADPAKPAFAKEVQGEWHVLLGVPASRLGLADDDTGLIGGLVKIEADRLTLFAPGEKPETLLTAECRALPGPLLNEQKKPRTGQEAEATLGGKLTGARRLTWAVSTNGILHIKILTSDPDPKGRYQSDAWGPGPETLWLALQRKAVPPRSKPSVAADAKLLLGNWNTLIHLDDAFLKNPGLAGSRKLAITAERVNEVDDKGVQIKGPIGFWGTYRLAEPVAPFGAIDLQLESWAGGGAGLMGRAPSLYAFHGDDLLYIVYTETDRREEAKRTRCVQFRSDGNQNLFVLERIPTKPKDDK